MLDEKVMKFGWLLLIGAKIVARALRGCGKLASEGVGCRDHFQQEHAVGLVLQGTDRKRSVQRVAWYRLQ